MSQLLALELCGEEVRIAAASVRGGRVTVEQVFGFPLAKDSGEESAAALGKQLASVLAEKGLGRCDVVAAVGRGGVELRQLALPQAPDEELPDMVRFQAMREFNELSDDWLMDFVPLEGSAEGTRGVLAAAVRPELPASLRAACEAAGCRLTRLVLRSCATASCFAHTEAMNTDGLRLLVDLTADEAELTVTLDGRVVFPRTARLAGDPLLAPEHAAALSAEIRRTIAAAENRSPGRNVESVVLFGGGDAGIALAKAIQDSIGVKTASVDPLAGLPMTRSLRQNMPQQRGGLAPLLGMLLAEAAGSEQGIDFLNPRRRPDPPSRRSRWIALGVAVALLVGAWFGYRQLERIWLVDEIVALDAQLKAANQAAKLETRVKEIEKLSAGDQVWLDELAYLSERFPPAKEAMLSQLTFGPTKDGGEVKVDGSAQGDAIDRMVVQLRDATHHVIGKESTNDTSRKGYQWRFSASLLIGPEKK